RPAGRDHEEVRPAAGRGRAACGARGGHGRGGRGRAAGGWAVSYCNIAPGHPFHGPYHDTEYGFPSRDDAVLFERLVLEINQAGLSWLTILRKRAAFTAAFEGWDIDRIAAYGEREGERLLADPGIIRNRLKVRAAIENAKRIIALRE